MQSDSKNKTECCLALVLSASIGHWISIKLTKNGLQAKYEVSRQRKQRSLS